MSKLEFTKNDTMGIGVEIELQLIDPDSGDLKPMGPAVLSSLKFEPDSSHIKSELFQSMLEIDTPICSNAWEAGTSMRKSLDITRNIARKYEAQVMMSGTHPFAHYSERLLTPSSRYFSLVDRNQWIARRLQIFGLHVHLGMRDGDHAIAMNNALCHYLPMVLALSASSPYWLSEDTGMASSRITIFEAIPTGGHPYLLQNWSEFENLVDVLTKSKSITSIKDLWWDIRPNTSYGTIEIRIADCPPTVKEVEALVALIHTLAVYIENDLAAGRLFAAPPEWILRENKWRASRHGVSAEFIRSLEGDSIPFQQIWNDLKIVMEKTIQQFEYKPLFDFLDQLILKGPSYIRQRHHFDGNLKSVVSHLERETRLDQPEWGKKS